MFSKQLSLTIVKKALIETFDQENVYSWNHCAPIAIKNLFKYSRY